MAEGVRGTTLRRLGPWLILLALAGIFFARGLSQRLPSPLGQTDLRIYADCARLFFGPEPPFSTPAFTTRCFYPVAFYSIAWPVVGELTPDKALAFSVGVMASCVACVLLPLLIVRRLRGASGGLLVVGAGALLLLSPFENAVALGNLSPTVAALVFAALLLLAPGPRAASAGVVLALAAVIKLFPIYLAAYLVFVAVLRRRRDLGLAGAVALALFALAQLTPGSLAFWRFTLSDALASAVVGRGSNNALPALLSHLGVTVPPLLLLVVLGVPVALRMVRAPAALDVEASLVLIVALLTSPAVWAHSYALLALALIVAGADLHARLTDPAELGDRSLRAQALLRALGLVYCVLVFANATDFSLRREGVSVAGLALSSTMPFVLGALLWTTRPAPQAGEGAP